MGVYAKKARQIDNSTTSGYWEHYNMVERKRLNEQLLLILYSAMFTVISISPSLGQLH